MDQKPQVNITHYDFLNYVTWERWQSYYFQIEMIMKYKPKSVLVIGPGDKIVTDILTRLGLVIKTADIDPNLSPDYLVSVTDLTSVIYEKFDLVLCSQVLEHLTYDNFEKSLREIKSLANEHVLLTLPYRSFRLLNLVIDIILLPKLFFSVEAPRHFKEFKFDGEHHWELGAKNYPVSRIKSDLRKYFRIESHDFVKANPYHYYFDLKTS